MEKSKGYPLLRQVTTQTVTSQYKISDLVTATVSQTGKNKPVTTLQYIGTNLIWYSTFLGKKEKKQLTQF